VPHQQWFESLEEAREQLEEWRNEYNRERPHSSLSNLPPEEYLARWGLKNSWKKPKTNLPFEILSGGRSTSRKSHTRNERIYW
jgi:hypothetical protein